LISATFITTHNLLESFLDVAVVLSVANVAAVASSCRNAVSDIAAGKIASNALIASVKVATTWDGL